MVISSKFLLVDVRAAVVLATVAVASCAPSHSLQQVKTSNPSVTYEYRGDQELLQAQQNAATFCNQYDSAPQPARFTSGSNGESNNVVFECDPNLRTPARAQQMFDPNLTYSYRTDQELLNASWNAQTYCMNNGSQRAVSNIRTNTDGSRTVTFQCTRG
jgi:hypothetical protein